VSAYSQTEFTDARLEACFSKNHKIAMTHEINCLGLPIGNVVADWVPPPPPPREVIEGQYCRLEPLDVATHAPSLFAANLQDEKGLIWTYLPYGPFDNFNDYCQWMEKTCLGNDPLFFAIRNLKTDEVTGLASYLRIDPKNGSIEVGHLNYSPKLQKSIAATEAMYLMMRLAFELGYRRYEWKCNSLNAPSRAAAARLGLTFEGVFRQHTIVKGRNRDSAWYSAIDSEWPKLRKAFELWLSPDNFDASGRQQRSLSELTAPLISKGWAVSNQWTNE
jgi:RimJ/RimL family protein N-acetyltransferase